MSDAEQEPTRADQLAAIRLLLAGLCAGDCLGSSSEFQPQAAIPAVYARYGPQGWPFRQVGGGPFGWKPGQSTDDGDQAMCLVRSFLELGRFDPADVGRRLVAWLDGGPPDVGGTTARTLGRLRDGVPYHESGLAEYLAHPQNAANGSLMRNGVIPGIMFGRDIDETFRATVQHAIITHYHPLPVLCCALQTWVIADELSEWGQGPCHDADGWLDAFHEDWTGYVGREDDPHVGAWLDRVRGGMQAAGETVAGAEWDPHAFNPFEVDYAGRAGYCLLTLQVGVWALRWSRMDEPFPVPAGFPRAVFAKRGPWTIAWPAMVGHDSDTYGAVAGPMVAAAHGSTPDDMTAGLASLDEFDRLRGSTD